jgi:hypothetical protein
MQYYYNNYICARIPLIASALVSHYIFNQQPQLGTESNPVLLSTSISTLYSHPYLFIHGTFDHLYNHPDL